MTKPTDFKVQNEGTIFLLWPLTPAAREWIDEHLPADRMEWAGAVAIEHRYIADILDGLDNDGLSFSDGA